MRKSHWRAMRAPTADRNHRVILRHNAGAAAGRPSGGLRRFFRRAKHVPTVYFSITNDSSMIPAPIRNPSINFVITFQVFAVVGSGFTFCGSEPLPFIFSFAVRNIPNQFRPAQFQTLFFLILCSKHPAFLIPAPSFLFLPAYALDYRKQVCLFSDSIYHLTLYPYRNNIVIRTKSKQNVNCCHHILVMN